MATKSRFTALVLILLIYLPALVSASHNMKLEVDKPLGFYPRGSLVTFNLENKGQDVGNVNCWGIVAYQVDPNNPARFIDVAYEGTNGPEPCSEKFVVFAYQVPQGQTHTWKWDQTYDTNGAFKDANRQQVLDGEYVGEATLWQDIGNGIWIKKNYKSSHFYIEQDLDGDGTVDSQDIDRDGDGINNNKDKCPEEDSRGDDVNKNGCKDTSGDNDGDGLSNDLDACPDKSAEGATTAGGCPDRDGDGVPDIDNNGNKIDQCPDEKEYVNGYRDFDGCDDYAEEVGSKALAGATGVAAAGGAVIAGILVLPVSFVSDDASSALVGLSITLGIFAGLEFSYALDPPDVVNYNVIYDNKYSNPIYALTKSKERYLGALLVGECTAAAMQFKALQIYAEQSADFLNRTFSNSQIGFITNRQAKYFRTMAEPSEIFCYKQI